MPLAVRLRDRAVFESFYPGANAESLAHLQAAARAARRSVSWLFGPQASGKTHLLQALCAQAGASAAYLPLAELAPLGPEALEGWQASTWLCLDDIDAVVGQLPWERALFNLYREAEERGASVLVAAQVPPLALAFALPDLGSRFSAANQLPLKRLAEEEQRSALRLRAQMRGLELPEEAALYLQRRFPRDMDSLYGLLDTLDEAALEAGRRLTVPFIRDVLAQPPASGQS
jgi:DnaA family protein